MRTEIIKTLIAVALTASINAQSAEHITIRDEVAVAQTFSYYPAPNLSSLQSYLDYREGGKAVAFYGLYRVTAAPDGRVTSVRILRKSGDKNLDKAMVVALLLWRAKPSALVRIIDVDLPLKIYFRQGQ
jgi:TonB family protein